MTQQEKDKLHIKKQNRRYRKLIFGILSPLLTVLILISPLLIIGTMEYCATPSEPITVTYADCRWISGGRHTSLILYTADGKQWMLSHHLRTVFYSDVKDRRVVPGDRLTITWYPWIIHDAVATLSSSNKVYGDLDAWQAQQKKDSHTLFILSAIFLAVGFVLCLLIRYFMRREFAEVRQLKKKYRGRLAERESQKLP